MWDETSHIPKYNPFFLRPYSCMLSLGQLLTAMSVLHPQTLDTSNEIGAIVFASLIWMITCWCIFIGRIRLLWRTYTDGVLPPCQDHIRNLNAVCCLLCSILAPSKAPVYSGALLLLFTICGSLIFVVLSQSEVKHMLRNLAQLRPQLTDLKLHILSGINKKSAISIATSARFHNNKLSRNTFRRG